MASDSTRWRSIDRTLPLLISGLLVAIVSAFTLATYQRIERILLTTAGQRLQTASIPVAFLLEQASARFKSQLSRVAADPAVVGYLVTGRDAPAARRALAGAWAADDLARGRVELRRANGTVALDTSVGIVPAGSGWTSRVLATRGTDPRMAEVGPLFTSGDSTYSEGIAMIPSASTANGSVSEDPEEPATPRALGYVTDLRFIAGNGLPVARRLMGLRATVLLGSFQEGDWTDLDHPAPPPPPGARSNRPLTFESSTRGSGVGVATPIRGTPWTVWVEQPRSIVLAPMQSLVAELAMLAALFIALGAVGAWLLSRRITGPIMALALAAEEIEANANLSRSDRTGQDEITRLMAAFGHMAARVEDARHELETRVAARTHQLEMALSDLKNAHERLVQKERMAMLGQLSSAVGHELRNPLGVMTNALYVIEHTLTDAPALVGEYLSLLRGQIAISERIVGDLLDTAGAHSPQPAPVVLSTLVDTQLHRLGPLPGIEIRRLFPADLPLAVIDPAQVAQILLNVFSNAVQAMADSGGGTLSIDGRVDRARQLCLSVTDTGPGIAPAILERIFEPLFTTKARGLGLGLWVSRTLARANGAELSVTSREGNGACFVLTMPASQLASAATC